MKKILGMIALGLVAVLLVACTDKKNSKEHTVQDRKEVYAVSVVTSMDTFKENTLPTRRAALRSTVISQNALEVVKDYTALAEGLLNGEDGLKVINHVTDENSEYPHHLTIQSRGESYEFHYSELSFDETIDTDDDEVEIERKSDIKGIIIKNEITYQVIGTIEIEIEEDEESFETELIIYQDKDNYSIVKYEKETENEDRQIEIEKSFKHTVVQNGKKVSETKIELELEGKEIELKIEVTFGNNEGTYEFRPTKNSHIAVSYEIEGNQEEKGHIMIIISTDENGQKGYTYETK